MPVWHVEENGARHSSEERNAVMEEMQQLHGYDGKTWYV